MVSFLSFIVWDPIPEVIPGWNIPRWYGLLFALGFFISQQLLTYIWKKEGKPESDVGALTVYIVIATILGARLGHVLFYGADYYFSHPAEIFKVWEGGLASHGGAIGILVALFLYVKGRKNQSYLWVVDRLVIAVCITGCLIRMGNFMNSEILGKPTASPFGVVFARVAEETLENTFNEIENVEALQGTGSSEGHLVPIDLKIDFYEQNVSEEQFRKYLESNIKKVLLDITQKKEPNIRESPGTNLNYELKKRNNSYTAIVHTFGIARHPAQLYESLYCLLLFFFLLFLWNKWKGKTPEGLLFGLFLVILWSLRFLDEYLKENQEAFEDQLPLNMGQILSIPMVALGIFILYRTWAKSKKSA